jgi:hypothetical protein
VDNLQSLPDPCAAPTHRMSDCSVCHARLRSLRARLQEGVVACDACGDLGYLFGPVLCTAPGCTAGARWQRRCKAIERIRKGGAS